MDGYQQKIKMLDEKKMSSGNNVGIESSSEEDEITHDFFPFFRVHKDKHIERYMLTSRENPGLDLISGVETKDVLISSNPEIWGRIFLPKINNDDDLESEEDDEDNSNRTKSPERRQNLSLLIHFHGGAFCTGSAFGPITKQYLINLVSMAQVVALSVDYRLAPEHLLPTAYDDSWAAFQWVASHSSGNGPEPWFNDYVDFDRIFLGGESTGANIAHNVAIRASIQPFKGINLVGILAIHPFFCYNQPEKIIQYMYPSSLDLNEEPRLYPAIDRRLFKLACEKVLVCIAQYDKYRERGLTYYQTLQTMWQGKVELVETLGENHCFHLLEATSPNVEPFMAKLASFIK